MFGGYSTASKISVTPESALRASAVYACCRVISGTVGTLPLHVYKRMSDGGKERATNHPLYSILHDAPNDLLTSCEFREMMQTHLSLRGNAYARIVRDGGGRVAAIEPLHPDRVSIFVRGMTATYSVQQQDGGQLVFPQDQILHVRGMGSDGVLGLSPISLARESIGLSLAAERFGAKFFGNSARPSGAIEMPANLSDAQIQQAKKHWQETQGGDNQNGTAVLANGLKWANVSMTNDDAQFLETRQFQIPEIARIFGVPLHLIGDLSKATFSNIEQQSLEFVRDCIRPIAVRWEQRLNQVLLTPTERKSYYVEFNLEGLLRGDIVSRYNAYQLGINNGWLSANEIRESENMNPIEGGDTFRQPLNMGKLGEFQPVNSNGGAL